MIAPMIYTYAPDGSLTGSQIARPSPSKLDPGVFLMPVRSTTIVPPTVPVGQKAFFSASTKTWILKPI